MKDLLQSKETSELVKTIIEKLTSKEAGIIGVVGVGVAGMYMIVREGIKMIGQA